MQRIRLSLLGLPGVALLGSLALGCGQSEGGRCQVDSDCKSGLECTHGETGNGVCKRPGAGTGQTLPDASPDQPPAAPEVGPDSARSDTAVPYDTHASPDITSTLAEVEPDSAELDTTAPDATGSYDAFAGLDLTPAVAEVEPDTAQPDAAEPDATGSYDTAPATTTSDAPKSEAGAVDSMAID